MRLVLRLKHMGGKVAGAIHGHQQLVTQDPKVGQHALALEALKDLKIHHVEVTG